MQRRIEVAQIVEKRRQILHLHGPHIMKQQILIVLPYLGQILVHTLGILLELTEQAVLVDELNSMYELVINDLGRLIALFFQDGRVQLQQKLLAYLKIVALRLELLEQSVKKLVYVNINISIRRIVRAERTVVFGRSGTTHTLAQIHQNFEGLQLFCAWIGVHEKWRRNGHTRQIVQIAEAKVNHVQKLIEHPQIVGQVDFFELLDQTNIEHGLEFEKSAH